MLSMLHWPGLCPIIHTFVLGLTDWLTVSWLRRCNDRRARQNMRLGGEKMEEGSERLGLT